MTTPLLAQTWTLGNIPLNVRDDTTGVEWMVVSEEGWWVAPERRIDHAEVPYADGALRTRSFAKPRVITLEGAIIAPDRPALEAELRKLAALCSVGGLETLTDGTYSTQVEFSQRPDVVRYTQYCAAYQITLIAPDPKKYAAFKSFSTPLASATGGLNWADPTGLNWADPTGLDWGTVTSTGTLQLVNEGTAEAWPVFSIYAGTGTVTNPKIRSVTQGREIVYGGALSSSTVLTLTVDPLARTVTANGSTDQRALLTQAQWFAVPPGGAITISYEAASTTGGSATDSVLTASIRPAYW